MNNLNNVLNRVADYIESVCYDAHIPVVIGVDDIVVLADQCRFYARPISNQVRLRELQTHIYGAVPAQVYTYESAFANVHKLRGNLKPVVKGALKLPAYADFGVRVGGGAVLFDFKLSDLAGSEHFQQLDLRALGDSTPSHIVLGRTLEGDTVVLENEAPKHHHILLAGKSGSGKTTLGNTIIYGLATAYKPSKLQMLIMSGKQADIILWEGLPHLLHKPVSDPQDAMNILAWLENERQHRSQMLVQNKGELPRIFVYIGEINDLINGNDADFTKLISTLMRLGRSEKIHFCVTTQRPRGDKVGGVDAKGQFSIVFCGAMQNAQDAYIALGVGSKDAHFLPGRGAFVTSNGTRFQVGFISDELQTSKISETITALHQQHQAIESITLSAQSSIKTTTSQTDVHEAMQKLEQNELADLSIVALQNEMRWGYQRAARTFAKLQNLGVLSHKRNISKRCVLNRKILRELGEQNGANM